MTISICNALEVTPQPWRNGGGQTRELLAWPSIENWQIRISLADIDADGAFSAFPNTHRWFSVIEGHGVNLRFKNQDITQTLRSEPLQFDGSQVPYCSLINGSTRDLNLMVMGADSADAEIQLINNENPWRSDYDVRAMLTTSSGVWTNGKQTQRLRTYDFLWSAKRDSLAWSFRIDDQYSSATCQAWWLGANRSEAPL